MLHNFCLCNKTLLKQYPKSIPIDSTITTYGEETLDELSIHELTLLTEFNVNKNGTCSSSELKPAIKLKN